MEPCAPNIQAPKPRPQEKPTIKSIAFCFPATFSEAPKSHRLAVAYTALHVAHLRNQPPNPTRHNASRKKAHPRNYYSRTSSGSGDYRLQRTTTRMVLGNATKQCLGSRNSSISAHL